MISNINGYLVKPEWFIDKGSFGSVYKAEKEGKFFAIKIFQSELLKTSFKDRIDREIKAIKKISHPNVVKLYEYGTFVDNEFEYFYIVMDYVDGRTLTDFIGSIDETKSIEIIESVLDTLNAIHSDGIIHRDLKPSNIKINNNGVPIILDFGLAKLIDYSAITQTGERVGTYYYMSPEQVLDSKSIDYRSDYFSIGVLLYQLMTGVLPYDATNLPALINQIQNQYPKNPTEINEAISNQLENVILKLLEKEPYKRPQTVSDIINEIHSKPPEKIRRLDLSARCYIRLLNNEKEVFVEGFKEGLISHVIFPANFFSRFIPTLKTIVDSKLPFSTDPATNRLPYSAFSKTMGVKELPYSSGNEVSPIEEEDFSSISQIQSYVSKVLKFQIENGVTELVAPFFFASNTNSNWFQINLKLLKESINFRDNSYPKMPIWGGICMNVEKWHNEKEKNTILNSYVKISPDGYFVYGDPIGNQSNLTQLFHYADLLKKLQVSSSSPVVACRVNGFGLILLSLGISGISTGIASLDSFSEHILSDTKGDYGVDPRYYLPELLGMISLKGGVTTKLIDISNSSVGDELKCSCEYCSSINSGVLTNRNIKLHFLHNKNEEIHELMKLKDEDRLEFIEKRVNKAIDYVKILKKENIKVGDFSYLNTWSSLIQQFKKKS